MDQLVNIPTIASGAALTVSIGSFVYLNNKISNIEDNLTGITDRFASFILKINEHDEHDKIFMNKINEMRYISENIRKLNEDFSNLKSELSDTFDKWSEVRGTLPRKKLII